MCKHSGFTHSPQSLEHIQDISALLFERKIATIRKLLRNLQEKKIMDTCKLISILVAFRLSLLKIETMVRSIPNYHTDLYLLLEKKIVDPHSFLIDEDHQNDSHSPRNSSK